MIKPGRVVLLLLLVNALLAAFIFIFPTGEINIKKDLAIHFVTKDNLLHPKEINEVDISKIINNRTISSQENNLFLDSAGGRRNMDSVLKNLLNISYKIEYPDEKRNQLHHFYEELDKAQKDNTIIRIVHYGDSQIEADRMSGILREKFQELYGGCGIGMLPVMEIENVRMGLNIYHSTNWKKFAIYGGLYKGFDSRNYGMLGSVFRFYPPEDSLHTESKEPMHAWMSYTKTGKSFSRTNKFSNVKLYYGNVTSPVICKIYFDNKLKYTDTLQMGKEPHTLIHPSEYTPNTVHFEFTANVSPDIYGVAFDCDNGIAVDNVPMRGSSGIDFSRANLGHLSKQLKTANTKLIIMEYGVNVVPYDVKDFTFYETSYYHTLKALKDNNPGTDVLVIGLSDMTKIEGTDKVSWPSVKLIRDAQKKAAMRAGCAFWDLYEAMGGENSMSAWVEADPSLAEKDYTHFNYKGARIIGGMIFNAIMSDYYAYKKSLLN